MSDLNTVNWRSNKGGIARRVPLREVLPLTTPLTLNIEASAYCCLKCNYCPQSLSKSKKEELNIGTGFMSFDTFSALIDQCLEFPGKIKTLRFAGFGEPLMNENIDKMIKLAKEKEVAEKITVFTNGIPMTKDMAERLAVSGVDTILFDIQGLRDEDYVSVANTKVDFRKLKESIKYLHELNTWKGKIFIKTFKYIVKGREEEFFTTFKNISNDISIDDIYEQCKEIDFNGMKTEVKEGDKFGFVNTRYCSNPWYHLSIAANGNVHVCPAPISYSDENLRLGNINDSTIFDMWNSKKLCEIRRKLLNTDIRFSSCRECDYINNIPCEDRIDDIRDKLIKYCDDKEREFNE